MTKTVGGIIATFAALACLALNPGMAQADSAPPSNQRPAIERYAGYYQFGPRAVFTILQEGDRWFARLTGQGPIEIVPKGDGVFDAVGVAAELRFQTDVGSKVTGVVLRQNGREISAPRIGQTTAAALDPAIADSLIPRTWQERFVGAPRLIQTSGRSLDYWPCFSPDSATVLFAHSDDGREWSLMQASVTGTSAHLLAIIGAPASETRPSWSSSASLIAFTGTTGGSNQVWITRPDGTAARAVHVSGLSEQAFYPSWYPDGRHLAVMDAADNVIRRFDVAGGPASAMTDRTKVLAGMPSVSPDGKWIAFAGQRNLGQVYDQGQNVIWLAGPGGELKTLEAKPAQGRAPVWSPDGSHVAFESDRGSPDGRYAAFIIAKDGTGLTQITPYALNATHPVWSPDGKHMAFMIEIGTVTHVGVVDVPSGPVRPKAGAQSIPGE